MENAEGRRRARAARRRRLELYDPIGTRRRDIAEAIAERDANEAVNRTPRKLVRRRRGEAHR